MEGVRREREKGRVKERGRKRERAREQQSKTGKAGRVALRL